MTRTFKGKLPHMLLDGILELSDDTYIAVGSDTAYMYIGAVGGFFSDLPIIEKYYSTRKAAPYRPNKPFIPLLNRMVKDVYYRETPGEPRLLVFAIEGIEQGKSWLLSEYEQTRKSLETALRKIEKETNNENQADIV